jgi:hypothetical protein
MLMALESGCESVVESGTSNETLLLEVVVLPPSEVEVRNIPAAGGVVS